MQETDLKPKLAVSPIRTQEETANLYKAEMPHIPGVNETVAPPPPKPLMTPIRWAVLGGCVMLLAAGAGIRVYRAAARNKAALPAIVSKMISSTPAAPPDSVPDFVPPEGSATAATLKQLQEPWSSRQFTFVRPDTHASIPAMVIRLPGTSGERSSAYWAFSLAAPYSTCNLDYVTDLNLLASRYGYPARHPMLVAACDGTLFDPLRMATIGTGAYVRGDIARGPGIRPPIAIRVQVRGQSLIADRIEDLTTH